MAQRLRVLAPLPEVLDSILSTHVGFHKLRSVSRVSGQPACSSGLRGDPAHMWYTSTHAGRKHSYTKIK